MVEDGEDVGMGGSIEENVHPHAEGAIVAVASLHEADGPLKVEIGREVGVGESWILGGGPLSVGRRGDEGSGGTLSTDFRFG